MKNLKKKTKKNSVFNDLFLVNQSFQQCQYPLNQLQLADITHPN